MAGQRYCKGESWEKSFQKAVSQTGANGITGLKMMAEGIGRGPVGMIAGMAKSTAIALIDAKKEKKANQKKAAPKKQSSKPKKESKKKGGSKPKKSSPKKKSAPKKGGSKPKKGSSKKASPKKSSPKKSTHKKSAPKKSAPKKSAPKKAAPKKAASKKTKRDLENEDIIEVVNKRDFEVVERDEGMNFGEPHIGSRTLSAYSTCNTSSTFRVLHLRYRYPGRGWFVW